MTFRPEPPLRQTPGLAGRIQSLTGAGRYRTALEELFGMLDCEPDDQEALWLAMIVLATSYSRTSALKAPEPLSRRYLWDRRLDRLFAVCSRCQTSWVPAGALRDKYAKTSFPNATGLQCRACDTVICNSCADKEHIDLDLSLLNRVCSNCGQSKLQATVYPTGRPPLQLARRPEPIHRILVFREGPISPDPEYLMEVLEERSPDAIEQHARLTAFPMHPWPRDIEGVALATLARDQVLTGDSSGELAHGVFQDDSGARVFLLKVFERPTSKLASAIRSVLLDHLQRLPPGFSATVRAKLMQPARMMQTAEALEKLLRRAFAEARHVAEAYAESDLLLVLSVVPWRELAKVRSCFPRGYVAFLMEQVMNRATDDAVHWVLCSDGRETIEAHLSCMPKDRSAMLLVATDLLTPAEKAAGELT